MSIRRGGRLSTLALALGLVLALAACDSAEERAEKHFQAAMALIEAGDTKRARVEFRNVFKLDGNHAEARLAFARMLRDEGDLVESYRQYLRLVEQVPDNFEGRRALARMAFENQNWEEAGRHARAARQIEPGDPEVVALNAAVDYHTALIENGGDPDRVAAAVTAARSVLDDAQAAPIASRVVIDSLMHAEDWDDALASLDAAIAAEPEALELHRARLSALNALGDTAAIGARLKEMTQRFPDSPDIGGALVAWYMENDDPDGAEAYLRGRVRHDDPAVARQARIDLVEFLRRSRGAAAARDELDRLIAAAPASTDGRADADAGLYRSLRAGIDFDTGDRAAAIATMEALLAETPEGEARNDFRLVLARMLLLSGDEDGAYARVDEVLASDPNRVAALQMRATRLTREDRPGEAIATLRTALAQEPDNPDTLTLMAEAHLRDGSRVLAGERLALAVEAAGQRPAEVLRYASFLIEDNRLETAESVLIGGLRRAPEDIQLLSALGDLYLRRSDWGRIRGVIDRLGELGEGPAASAAGRLKVALLSRQERTGESLELLERMIADGDAGVGAAATVVRGYIAQGDADRAETYVEDLLAKRPDAPELRMMRAGVHLAKGETEAAETLYRALVESNPDAPGPVQALYVLLGASGRADEAAKVLAAGIEATGRSAQLLFVEAGRLEAAADYPGAIAIYEELYDRDSTNPVIANNLASLITTHQDDAESLERAFAIARRLRDSKLPAFQDTYGWIESRRGNRETALTYLEPAAKGLPDDPFVQLHLGLTYAALDRHEDARAALTRALDLAGNSDLPQFSDARKRLEGLPPGD